MVRCDMCEKVAIFHNISDYKLSLCNVCHTVVMTSLHMEELKAFWVDKYNELNERFTERCDDIGIVFRRLTQRITTLEENVAILETQLKQVDFKRITILGTDQHLLFLKVDKLNTIIKNLMTQVDLNSQTLEELQ